MKCNKSDKQITIEGILFLSETDSGFLPPSVDIDDTDFIEIIRDWLFPDTDWSKG